MGSCQPWEPSEARKDAGTRTHPRAALAGGGKVIAAGPIEEVEPAVAFEDAAVLMRAAGGCPGFVDAHTHLAFGWRAAEYGMRAASGYLTRRRRSKHSEATREASFEDLCRRSLGFLDAMQLPARLVEAKSGYGLDPETELAAPRGGILQQKRRWTSSPPSLAPMRSPDGLSDGCDSTRGRLFCPHREVHPPCDGYATRREGLDLARFVDVLRAEPTIEETRRILVSARNTDSASKCRVELKYTGATELACELGAVSCDHLIKVSEGIRELAQSNTIAVLLPATSVFLGECPGAPGRALLDAGAAVALGTDFNPGTSTAMSMPLCMTLACSTLRISPEEAFAAATWNAAWATGLGGKAGGLSEGFPADAVLFDADDYREVAYRFGTSLVRTVLKGGRVVVRDGELVKDGYMARTRPT